MLLTVRRFFPETRTQTAIMLQLCQETFVGSGFRGGIYFPLWSVSWRGLARDRWGGADPICATLIDYDPAPAADAADGHLNPKP